MLDLLDLIGDIGTTILGILKTVFVPDEETIEDFISSITEKFAFIDTIKNGVNGLSELLEDTEESVGLSITIPATKYTSENTFTLSFSWFADFKPYTDVIITAFVYIGFLWRLFIKIPATINGTSGVIVSSAENISESKGGK